MTTTKDFRTAPHKFFSYKTQSSVEISDYSEYMSAVVEEILNPTWWDEEIPEKQAAVRKRDYIRHLISNVAADAVWRRDAAVREEVSKKMNEVLNYNYFQMSDLKIS